MKKTLTLSLLLLLLPFVKGNAQKVPAALPGASWFIENAGQVTDMEGRAARNVLYTIEQPGLNIYVTTSGLTYVFLKGIKVEDGADDVNKNEEKEDESRFAYDRFDMELKGASISPGQITRSGETPHYYNFYRGTAGCAKTGVRAYTRITVSDVYPGIDWVLYAAENGTCLKYDFVVHPGADPDQICMLYRGKTPLLLENQKTLAVHTPLGSLSDHIPLAYAGDKSNKIAVSYVVVSDKQTGEPENRSYETQFRYRIAKYNPSLTLVIDPVQQTWGTYIGGTGQNRSHVLITDYDDNIITSGEARGVGYPFLDPGNNAYFRDTIAGVSEVFIAKFDSAHVLKWFTFYGGNSTEIIYALGVSLNNELYACGTTLSSDLIMADPGNGAFYQPMRIGNNDGIILRFSDTGVLLWGTYMSISATIPQDNITDLVIDPAGWLYICGYSSGMNTFPVTGPPGSYQQNANNSDAFVARFSLNGVLNWFTFFGSAGSELATGIDRDKQGNLLVTGSTTSPNLPVVSAPQPNDYYQPVKYGTSDEFIIRFTSQLALDWCTYFGGSNTENSLDVMVAPDNSVYLTGKTFSTDFPFVNPGGGAYYSQSTTSSIFIAHLTDQLELEWGTKLESLYSNVTASYMIGLTFGACGDIFVSGWASGDGGMLFNPGGGSYFIGAPPGEIDVFLARFDKTHQLVWGTYFGGSKVDDGMLVATDRLGRLYTAGDAGGFQYDSTTVSSFQNNALMNPGNGAFFQSVPVLVGIDHNFLMCFKLDDPLLAGVVAVNPSCPNYNDGSITVVPNGNQTISWIPSGSTSFSLTGLSPGSYQYTISDSAGCSVSGAVTLQAGQLYDINVIAADQHLCQGESTVLTASGVPSVTWNPPIGVGNTITVTPAVTTTYIATYTDSTGCINSDSVTVFVTPMPVAAVSCPDTVCAGDPFVVTASGGLVTSWLNAPNSPNPFNWIAQNDTTFIVTAYNGPGCPADTLTQLVTVIPCLDNVSENTTPVLNVWPNPAYTLVNIELPENELWSVEVFDAQGKRIVNTTLRGPKAQLSCAGWSEGNYLVRISKGEQMHHVKLVKSGK
jgi:hypothetical protein